MLSITLAFDVYGTLIDTHGVVSKLHEIIGSKAKEFSHTWREKQLEYSFRRGLMQHYENFAVCTSQALDYACKYHKVSLTREKSMSCLTVIGPFPLLKMWKVGWLD